MVGIECVEGQSRRPRPSQVCSLSTGWGQEGQAKWDQEESEGPFMNWYCLPVTKPAVAEHIFRRWVQWVPRENGARAGQVRFRGSVGGRGGSETYRRPRLEPCPEEACPEEACPEEATPAVCT